MDWPSIGVQILLILLILGLVGLAALLEAFSRRRGSRRTPGGNLCRAVSDLLILAGVASLLFALVIYLVEWHGSESALPPPVALSEGESADSVAVRPTPAIDSQAYQAVAEAAAPTAGAVETETSLPITTVVASPKPTAAATPTRNPAKPAVPVRLAIPSIDVDSPVQEVGTYWENGQLLWETVPFVVGHYKTTARAGETGNAVFSGHVTSRSAGNVFRELFKIRAGDEVNIYTADAMFVYVVTDVRLVLPGEIAVMDPTEDVTATLITCAGEWNQSERAYSHRLIVTTKLKR